MGTTGGCHRPHQYNDSGHCTVKTSNSGNAMCALFLMLFIIGVMFAGGILIKMLTATSNNSDIILSTRLVASEIDDRADKTDDKLDDIQRRLERLNAVDLSSVTEDVEQEGRRTRGVLKTHYDATTSRMNQIVVEQDKLKGLLKEILCEVKKLRD